MTELSQRIFNTVNNRVHGWCVPEKIQWFENLFTYCNPKVCVELGVFFGKSAIAQGLLIKELGLDCKLYAVDAWAKEPCLEGSNSQANSDWWATQDFEAIYQSFVNSVNDLRLQDIVIPIRSKSTEWKDIPEIDILHQDSNHSKEVILEELKVYAPKVSKYWIADDARWAEALEGYAKVPDYGFELIHEHFKDGQSFNVYKSKLFHL